MFVETLWIGISEPNFFQRSESKVTVNHLPAYTSAERRLGIMRDTEDGFRIAEEDLKMRGAGDVIGTAQSGLPRFKVANLEHQSALMATAHQDARMLLQSDPALTSSRGKAARILLWLMEQDQAVQLISVG